MLILNNGDRPFDRGGPPKCCCSERGKSSYGFSVATGDIIIPFNERSLWEDRRDARPTNAASPAAIPWRSLKNRPKN